MSGYNAFSDPLLIPERLYELNYDETALFKKVYEKFGRRVFDTNEFNEICLEYGLTVRRLNMIKYIRQVGKSVPKQAKRWEICPDLILRFEESAMIQFEPYKMDAPPYVRYKVGKWKLFKLGMTLDGNWFYCKVKNVDKYDFVMCKVSHMSRKRKAVPVYKVDWEKCEKWLNTQKFE